MSGDGCMEDVDGDLSTSEKQLREGAGRTGKGHPRRLVYLEKKCGIGVEDGAGRSSQPLKKLMGQGLGRWRRPVNLENSW